MDDPAAAAKLAAELRLRVASSFSVGAMVDGVLSAYREAMARAIPIQDAALAGK